MLPRPVFTRVPQVSPDVIGAFIETPILGLLFGITSSRSTSRLAVTVFNPIRTLVISKASNRAQVCKVR
jgi:hypothetical protein